MPFVRLQGASFSYTDAAPILDAVDLVLTPGWAGLVGPNGAGKSTLLRLVDGSLTPTAGVVRRDPEALRVAHCPQQVEDRSPAIDAFAGAWDGPSRRLHGRLRLDPDDLERWPTLSPGERKRWQIGAALAAEPDVLLVDEPTNHLDVDARGWLVDALAAFRGIGVVVSHDRRLLDALTARTIRVERGALEVVDLPYSQARAAWDQALQRRLDARDAAQEEARRLARQLGDARRDREAAERQRSARVRMRSRHDSDARGLLAQTRADWAEGRLARRVHNVRRRVEEARAEVHAIAVETPLGRSVFARFERCPQPLLAAREAAPIERGGRVLIDAPALTWGREDRIWIAGPNGAGKTSLIEALLDNLRAPRERLLVLAQDLADDDAVAALAWLRDQEPEARARVLAVVAALGVAPERLLASARPSPGEARKLLIARGLGTCAWGLVLDEPTNHLDLPSIERLEAALVGYPGAIMLVSHDEAFARACTRSCWRIDGGGIVALGSG